MFQPKPEVYNALKALGYYCLQGSQAVFNDGQVPAVTFRVSGNSVDLQLDNEISSQQVTITVDIWSDDSITASRILSEAETAMRAVGYRLTNSFDVPSPEGALFHIQCTFDGIKTTKY